MTNKQDYNTGAVFSYKLRYIIGFRLVEIAISTNQKPTIYRNLYENTGPGIFNHNISRLGSAVIFNTGQVGHNIRVLP